MALRRISPALFSLRTLRAPMSVRALSQTTDSHSDFAPIRKNSTIDVKDRIQEHINNSKVVLYMKGLPTEPACGFSWRTVQVLNAVGVEYTAHNVLIDDQLREGIKEYSAWPTIPQLYVGGEFVGGCDIVEGLARNGDLQKLIQESGARVGEQPAPTDG